MHSLKFGFSSCRTVTYKLKQQINIDELAMVANFSITRKYKTGTAEVSDELHCKLLGVRIPRDEFYQETPYYDGERNDVQWVEISGSEYSIEELDLIKWLRLYGEVLTPLSEKLHPDSTEDCPIGNGTYTVKMKLKEQIPQFMPACGKKLRIQYLGINN